MEEKEFQAILAQKLKTLLLKSGKKQKHLAEGMGVTTSFIGNFFNERDKASVYRVNQMLESMGKPSLLDWLDSLIRNEPEKKTAFMNSSQSLRPSSKKDGTPNGDFYSAVIGCVKFVLGRASPVNFIVRTIKGEYHEHTKDR